MPLLAAALQAVVPMAILPADPVMMVLVIMVEKMDAIRVEETLIMMVQAYCA